MNETEAASEDVIASNVPVDNSVKRPRLGKFEAEFSLTSSKRDIGVINTKTNQVSVRRKHDVLDSPRESPVLINDEEYTMPFELANGREFRLPPGLTVITGGTAEGKSSLLRAMGVPRLLAVEPADNLEELKLPLYDEFDHAMLVAALRTLKTKELMAVDSLRGPLFEISGAAGPKGISMPFFTQITRVSNSLAKHGIAMLVPVNPLIPDPEYVEAFISMLSSAVPGLITLKGSRAKEGIFKGTVSDRSERAGVQFIYDVQKQQKVTSESVMFDIPRSSDPDDGLSGMQINQLESLGESL